MIITSASNSTVNIRTNRTLKACSQKWEEKQLFGYFKQKLTKSRERRARNGYERKILSAKLNLF